MDRTEALEIFDQLTPQQQEKALEFMRMICADPEVAEKLLKDLPG